MWFVAVVCSIGVSAVIGYSPLPARNLEDFNTKSHVLRKGFPVESYPGDGIVRPPILFNQQGSGFLGCHKQAAAESDAFMLEGTSI